MYVLDKEKARQVLLQEGTVGPSSFNLLLKDFPILSEPLDQAVENWLNGKGILPVEVEGLSIQVVMANRHNHFLTAVKELSILVDQNRTREEIERWKQVLSKPLSFE